MCSHRRAVKPTTLQLVLQCSTAVQYTLHIYIYIHIYIYQQYIQHNNTLLKALPVEKKELVIKRLKLQHAFCGYLAALRLFNCFKRTLWETVGSGFTRETDVTAVHLSGLVCKIQWRLFAAGF